MQSIEQKTKRLWAAFFPVASSSEFVDGVRVLQSRVARPGASEESIAGAGRMFASLSSGPFPLEAFGESLSAQLAGSVEPEVLTSSLAQLSRELNELMFAGMAKVCAEHFSTDELEQALTFVSGPLWRGSSGAELSAFNRAIERWQTERFLPLLEGYREHLRGGAPRPTLPPIEVDDPLAMRLLSARGIDPDSKSTTTGLLQRWSQDESTALLRGANVWGDMCEQLLQDLFWRRFMVEQYRSFWREEELSQVVSFYESLAGQKLNTLMARWNQENQAFMSGEVMKEKFSGWLDRLVE